MRIHLVTGGAGFIGSHIVAELVARGERVRVLDNFLTGKRENIAPFLDRIELIEGDIRDPAVCRRAVEGVDGVLHQAALPSVPRSIENPLLSHDINVNGTLNLLWAAREAKAGKFVLASSSSVYGDADRLPQKEGQEGNVLSPYALGKKAGEMYCSLFHRLYGLETVALRYFNVFGPRQDPFSQYAAAVPLFITKFLSGESPTIFGDGEQSRDFTFVANVVEANLRALDAPAEALGQAFNIACGQPLTVNTLADDIKRLTSASATPVHAEARPGEIRHSLADISKAARLLRYRPLRSFSDGLAETVLWYQGRR
jgi:UDP-N-acetylglucosamine/UDP-N-acetylgalactosamine 4-epimerase